MENSLANAIGPGLVSTLAVAFGYRFGSEARESASREGRVGGEPKAHQTGTQVESQDRKSMAVSMQPAFLSLVSTRGVGQAKVRFVCMLACVFSLLVLSSTVIAQVGV